ncbi:T9SS type A sorting domain-containing protein [Soonwooa sp.]|uniref:T9SS type A sorting domain-containing protein n=1 Tax=Soonwooa sp. TaxID=1938592 RepID=UPI002604D4B8|nr:T9SS type A sorting domain-containing protein [Soonwooa sp.]
MKIFLSTILFISSLTIANAQVVSFPDPAFKGCVNSTPLIDLNKDGQIQVSEAELFTGKIDCSSQNIKSIAGIETFKNLSSLILRDNMISEVDFSNNVNLEHLVISNNKVTKLDVSKNLALTLLFVENNKLDTLDVTKNKALTSLWIGYNNIENIDLSQNLNLDSFYAYGNLFKTIDLSKNINLSYLYLNKCSLESLDLSNNKKLYLAIVGNNKLTSLNIKNSNNTLIKSNGFDSSSNPELKCIEVDDVNYSNSTWLNKNPESRYSTDCKLATSESKLSEISVFPNPATNVLNFSKLSNVELYNVTGQKLLNQTNIKTLDVSNLNKGVYFVVIKDNDGITIQKTKVIKE